MKKGSHVAKYGSRYMFAFTILLSFSLLNNSCKKFDFKENHSDSRLGDEKCENNNSNSNNLLSVIQHCGTASESNLIAGQNIDIGAVSVYNTFDSLFIDLSADGNWWMQSASVYVGTLANMPQAPNGNPKVGQFQYQKTLNPKKKEVRFAIPLAGLPSCFMVVVHSDVVRVSASGQIVQTETAWGQGQNLPGANWAMGISYCRQACVNCTYNTIATSLKAEGKLICGQIMITNDQDSVYVTYNVFTEWRLRKIHLYVGSYGSMPVDGSNNPVINSFPKVKTYTNAIQGSVTFGFSLNNLPANYIVAAHAETESVGSGNSILIQSAWGDGTPFVNSTTWGWTISYSTQICS